MLSIDKQMLFLLTCVPSISIQRFLEIYTARGYSQQSVRNIVSRLKQLGYIEAVKRSQYAITEHGQRTLISIASKGFHYGDQWDGQWQLVTFEIHESDRSKRYQLRGSLISLGFAALHKNTYICPWDYVDEVDRLTAKFELRDNVAQMKGAFQHFAITPELAARMWGLEKIKAAHQEKWNWFHQDFIPATERYKQAGDALQLFILYLELGEIMGELVILDPMLPAELLPPGWMGQQVMSTFNEQFGSMYHDIPKDAYYYPLMKND